MSAQVLWKNINPLTIYTTFCEYSINSYLPVVVPPDGSGHAPAQGLGNPHGGSRPGGLVPISQKRGSTPVTEA